jgi:hypothetical protein
MSDAAVVEPTVQCVNCGYVSLRRRSTRELSEVEVEIRTTGVIPTENDPKRPGELTYEPPLVCFRQRFNLSQEQRLEISGNVGPADRIMHVLNKGRRCAKFKQWEQGFTPKEHADMDMIERQQVRQDARDAAAREFQAAQAALADQRHRETLEAAADREGKSQTAQWLRTIVALIVGGVFTLVAGWLRSSPQSQQSITPPAIQSPVGSAPANN